MKENVSVALEKLEIKAIDKIAGRNKHDKRSRSAILRLATLEYIFNHGFNKPSARNSYTHKKI